MPPSTRKVDAVMNDESSEARNAAAAAISEASPKRPMGMCTSRRAARSGSVAKSSCEQRRVDRTRAERVHPHPLAGELHAELARQGEHAALGSRVADLAGRRAHDGNERRGVDDRAPAAGEQVRDGVLAAQIDRREVDPLDALPRLEPGVEDGVVVGRADAGVVAADVDARRSGRPPRRTAPPPRRRTSHRPARTCRRPPPPPRRRRSRRGRPRPPWRPRRRSARTWRGRCRWRPR